MAAIWVMNQGKQQRAMNRRVIGRQHDSFAEAFNRLVDFAAVIECVAQIPVSGCVVALEADGLAESRDGLVELSHVAQQTSNVAVGHGKPGLEPQRLAVSRE